MSFSLRNPSGLHDIVKVGNLSKHVGVASVCRALNYSNYVANRGPLIQCVRNYCPLFYLASLFQCLYLISKHTNSIRIAYSFVVPFADCICHLKCFSILISALYSCAQLSVVILHYDNVKLSSIICKSNPHCVARLIS